MGGHGGAGRATRWHAGLPWWVRGRKAGDAHTDCGIALSAGPHLWGTPFQEPGRATPGQRQQVVSDSGEWGWISSSTGNLRGTFLWSLHLPGSYFVF